MSQPTACRRCLKKLRRSGIFGRRIPFASEIVDKPSMALEVMYVRARSAFDEYVTRLAEEAHDHDHERKERRGVVGIVKRLWKKPVNAFREYRIKGAGDGID